MIGTLIVIGNAGVALVIVGLIMWMVTPVGYWVVASGGVLTTIWFVGALIHALAFTKEL